MKWSLEYCKKQGIPEVMGPSLGAKCAGFLLCKKDVKWSLKYCKKQGTPKVMGPSLAV